MIQCMIVDDEPLAQQVLEKYIRQMDGLELAAKCFHAADAFAALHQYKTDLIFLDIKMPSVSGIDFIRSLKDPPAFIFTTAFSEHALQSYELQAVDYLLKPITYERFKKSIDRFLGQYVIQQVADEKKYFYIKANGSLVKLFFDDVLYAQSMKDYIKIVTVNKQYLTHLTMQSLLNLIPSTLFRRVHRSYVINLEQIGIIHKDKVVVGNVEIPLGENYKSKLTSP